MPTMLQYPTDEQQGAIYALGEALDAPSEADRAFFERHPERWYLVTRTKQGGQGQATPPVHLRAASRCFRRASPPRPSSP
jgi:hypothetical protein